MAPAQAEEQPGHQPAQHAATWRKPPSKCATSGWGAVSKRTLRRAAPGRCSSDGSQGWGDIQIGPRGPAAHLKASGWAPRCLRRAPWTRPRRRWAARRPKAPRDAPTLEDAGHGRQTGTRPAPSESAPTTRFHRPQVRSWNPRWNQPAGGTRTDRARPAGPIPTRKARSRLPARPSCSGHRRVSAGISNA